MKDQDFSQWDDPRPGFKWSVRVTQPIAASQKKVWEVISMPGNLDLCHPFCAKNPIQEWPGEESRDEVHYLSGWVYERRFCNWIEGVGYDLEIGEHGGKRSFVSWRIKPVDAGNCILRITVYPYILQNLPAPLRWLPHQLYIGPKLSSYLSSVGKGFEWYIIRGEPVPKNQFGAHPWFS